MNNFNILFCHQLFLYLNTTVWHKYKEDGQEREVENTSLKSDGVCIKTYYNEIYRIPGSKSVYKTGLQPFTIKSTKTYQIKRHADNFKNRSYHEKTVSSKCPPLLSFNESEYKLQNNSTSSNNQVYSFLQPNSYCQTGVGSLHTHHKSSFHPYENPQLIPRYQMGRCLDISDPKMCNLTDNDRHKPEFSNFLQRPAGTIAKNLDVDETETFSNAYFIIRNNGKKYDGSLLKKELVMFLTNRPEVEFIVLPRKIPKHDEKDAISQLKDKNLSKSIQTENFENDKMQELKIN